MTFSDECDLHVFRKFFEIFRHHEALMSTLYHYRVRIVGFLHLNAWFLFDVAATSGEFGVASGHLVGGMRGGQIERD